jgi:isopenicillin N synthase-like dioxygenase
MSDDFLIRCDEHDAAGWPAEPFIIKMSSATQALVDRAVRSSQEFHRRPLEDKMLVAASHTTGCHGYVPFHDERVDRRYESFDLGHERPAAASDGERVLCGPVPWPAQPEFRRAAWPMFSALETLGLRIAMRWATQVLDDSRSLSDHVTAPCSQGRLMHYAPREAAVGGLGAHTDYEAVTVSWQSSPGIELQLEEHGWKRPPAHHDELLILVGDSMELLSNGRLRSTRHRVDGVTMDRWAIVTFVGLDYATPLPRPLQLKRGTYSPRFLGDHIVGNIRASHSHLRERSEAAGVNPIAEDRI